MGLKSGSSPDQVPIAIALWVEARPDCCGVHGDLHGHQEQTVAESALAVVEEPEHCHLGNDLLDAAANAVKDMVGLHAGRGQSVEREKLHSS